VEQVRGQRHISSPRDRDRLAVIQRLQLGQLVGVIQDQVTDPPDDPAALGRGQSAPRPVIEGSARGADRPVDVLGVALGDAGERLAGGRIRRLERLARRRVDPLPADEQLSRGGGEWAGTSSKRDNTVRLAQAQS
jgi:hypothetical protein